MPDPNLVRINDIVYSWASTAFTWNGFPVRGILELSFEQKRERKVVYAANQSGRPIGKTSGKYSVPSCTVKMLKDTADSLTTDLTALGLGSYGDAVSVITVHAVEPVVGSLPLIAVLSGVTIDGKKDAHVEGIDELVTEFELGVLNVIENGKVLWSVARNIL